MPARARLTLYEEILLLALDDEKGTGSVAGTYANARRLARVRARSRGGHWP